MAESSDAAAVAAARKAFCETCAATTEVEAVDEDGDASEVFCLTCGEEFTIKEAGADKFKGFAIGLVTAVEPVPKRELKKAQVDVGSATPVVVVTNAKHCNVGDRVVVATVGAVVPAGAVLGEDPGAVEVKATSVGGVKSHGMLCDSPMLGWVGGAAGIIQTLDDSFAVGALPPDTRPRKKK